LLNCDTSKQKVTKCSEQASDQTSVLLTVVE